MESEQDGRFSLMVHTLGNMHPPEALRAPYFREKHYNLPIPLSIWLHLIGCGHLSLLICSFCRLHWFSFVLFLSLLYTPHNQMIGMVYKCCKTNQQTNNKLQKVVLYSSPKGYYILEAFLALASTKMCE